MKDTSTRGYGLLEPFLARRRINHALGLIPKTHPSGRVLDIGCGVYPIFLLQANFLEKYGLDRAIESGALLNDGLSAIDLRHHDIENETPLPYGDDFFDVITMLAVVEHVSQSRIGSLLKEVRRVLRTGGVFILTTPAPWTQRLLSFLSAIRLVSPVEIAEHKGAYGAVTIKKLLADADFSPFRMESGYFELGMNVWVLANK